MDVFTALQKRHSYRKAFQDKAIPKEDLKKIVQAGLLAPSGCNAQTTEFVIIDDALILQKIGDMSGRKGIMTAKALILCLIDKTPAAVYEGHSFQAEDCAAAVENMLLAITALGYASVWTDGWLRINNHAQMISGLVGIPENKIIRVLLPVGVPVEKMSQGAKKSFEQRASFNQYKIFESSVPDDVS